VILNALPTAVVVPVGFTVSVGGVTRSFEECVGAFQKMAGAAAGARRGAIEHEVACGKFLIECRACMDRLVWGRFLQRIGINQKTALRQVTMAMKIGAAASGSGRRGKSVVDWAKFEACVREWNARNPEGTPLHIKAGPVSLRRAQVVVGARPAADFSQTSPKISQTQWVREKQHEHGGERGASDSQDREWAGGSTVVNSLPLGVGAHNAPASFPHCGDGAGGVQPPSVAGSLLLSPALPAVKDRGDGLAGGGVGGGGRAAQMSLADEYEAVQVERRRLEAMLAEIAAIVQASGGGGVDVRGTLARIGGDVEGLLRSVRGS